MQMRGYGLSMFAMGRHTERVPPHRGGAKKRDGGKPGFLQHLSACCGLKACVAVVMAASPAPGSVDIVIDHQSMGTGCVDDPGRGGEMADGVFTCIQLCAECLPRKPDLLGSGTLLLVKGMIMYEFIRKEQ